MRAARTIALALLGAIVLFASPFLLRGCGRPDHSIPSSGGAPFSLPGAAEPYYVQTDPAWAEQRIGGSEEPLGAVGCTVCCLSMALAQCGRPIDPAQLNAALRDAGGYTPRGLLDWTTAAQVAGEGITIEVLGEPSYETIDSALHEGAAVIVKILLKECIPHWVLVAGKDGPEYLVKDPLDSRKKLRRLSSLSSRIRSVRIVRAAR